MQYAEHIAAVERETAAFAKALTAGDMNARVPTCPDWTLADLAQHLGGVLGFWTHILCEAAGRPKAAIEDRPGPSPGLWFVQIAGLLVAELKATTPDATVWTWDPDDQSAAFAARRMAHETAVHRYDAQTTVGRAEGIEPALAADGIEEIFVMVGAYPDSGRGDGETMHVHGTDDAENEWLITMNPDGLDIRRDHAKGDLALRGHVSDLELVLYDRPPLGTVERFGNESVLDAWYRVFKFG